MYKNVLLTDSEIKVLRSILEQNISANKDQKDGFSPQNLTILLRQLDRVLTNQN